MCLSSFFFCERGCVFLFVEVDERNGKTHQLVSSWRMCGTFHRKFGRDEEITIDLLRERERERERVEILRDRGIARVSELR